MSTLKHHTSLSFVTLVVMLTVLVQTSLANDTPQEISPAKKSLTVARVLAFDPIPGDTLFYAGKIKIGIIDSLVGSAGAFIGTAAIIGLVTHKKSTGSSCNNNSESSLCTLNEDLESIGEAIVTTFAVLGMGAYLGSLIVDGVLGMRFVREYNEAIDKKKTTSAQWIPQPSIMLVGANTGLNLKWKF